VLVIFVVTPFAPFLLFLLVAMLGNEIDSRERWNERERRRVADAHRDAARFWL
jgi:hypothetical protein